MEELLEIEEPKFLRELHNLRKKLSKMRPDDYEDHQKKVMEYYRKHLGHLYIEK